MKSFAELLEEIGFNENAPMGTKKALLKHLLAEGARHERSVSQPRSNSALETNNQTAKNIQSLHQQSPLSFFKSKDTQQKQKSKIGEQMAFDMNLTEDSPLQCEESSLLTSKRHVG